MFGNQATDKSFKTKKMFVEKNRL